MPKRTNLVTVYSKLICHSKLVQGDLKHKHAIRGPDPRIHLGEDVESWGLLYFGDSLLFK